MNPSRRRFIANVVGSTAAIAAAGLAPRDLLAADARSHHDDAPQGTWDMSWVERVQRAKHRQVFDVPEISEGMVFNNVSVWLSGYHEVYNTADSDMAPVLVFRHQGVRLALGDAMWARLKIGEDAKLKDPTTGEPATRHPFMNRKPDDKFWSIMPDGGLDTLISRGATVLCCNLALMRQVGPLMRAENLTREQAQQALIEGLAPGVIRMPNGVFATTRAEEAGCGFLRSA
jgi:hypothetical protein